MRHQLLLGVAVVLAQFYLRFGNCKTFKCSLPQLQTSSSEKIMQESLEAGGNEEAPRSDDQWKNSIQKTGRSCIEVENGGKVRTSTE
jgi:hypothetical protein